MQSPTISDIQTTEMLYYDPHFLEECYAFCKMRDIDCLPSIEDFLHYYLRNKDAKKFEKRKIEKGKFVEGKIPIFLPALLQSFKDNHLLFVVNHGQLTGVVHFSDYGRQAVSEYLYTIFFDYERTIRDLLILGLKIEKGDLNRFSKGNRPPFQHYYLKELLDEVKQREKLDLEVGTVNKLRNQIMHAHELIEMKDVQTDDYVYTWHSYRTFFTSVQTLLKDYVRVKTRLKIRTGLFEKQFNLS